MFICPHIFGAATPKHIDVDFSELKTLYRVINSESHGECFEDKMHVGSVILNRVESALFPNTIKEVVYQRGQFSGIGSWLYKKDDLANPYTADSYKAARLLLIQGPMNDALFFHNPAIADSTWVETVRRRYRKVHKTKNHHFFTLK